MEEDVEAAVAVFVVRCSLCPAHHRQPSTGAGKERDEKVPQATSQGQVNIHCTCGICTGG